jgi:hypothetical protein
LTDVKQVQPPCTGKRDKVNAVALFYLLPYTHGSKLRVGIRIIQYAFAAESEARLCGERRLKH